MGERYTRLFSLTPELYAKGSPIVVAAGALLKDTVTDRVLAQLKLRNIGQKKITEVTVQVQPLDAEGLPLGEAFEHRYVDLEADREHEFAQKVPVFVPDNATKGFFASVIRTSFADGSRWENDGTVWEPLEVPAPLSDALGDPELVSEYYKQFGADSSFLPLQHKDLWYCSCGTMNRREEEVCRKCGKSLAAFLAFDLTELTARKETRLARQAEEERIARENLRKAEEERRKKEEEEAEAAAIAAKKRRKRNAIIAAILIPVLLIAAAVAAIILTKPARVLSDAEEMAAAGDYMAAVAVLDEYGHPDKTGTARQGYLDAMEQEIKAMIDRKDFHAALELIDRYAVLDTKGENIRTIQKLCGHDLKDSGHADHTCTKDGYTHRTCAVCGWVEETILPALGHQYVLETTNPSTCSEQGSEVFACSVCGDNYTEMLELLPHEYESSVTRAATCTEEGVRTNTCTVCGHATEEAISLVEHKNKETVTKAATCTETGVRTISCTVCGKTSQESIPTIPHSNKDTIVREATCTKEGLKNSVCTVCGTVANSVAIPMVEHTYKEQVTKEATCAHTGEKETLCTICGEKKSSVVIPVLEHMYEERVVTKVSCTEQGVIETVCSECGKIKSTKTIRATGHSYVKSVVSTLSCETDGVLLYTCSHCNESYTETEEATGHSWRKATCEEPKTCRTCGETDGVALGHKWTVNASKYSSRFKCETCYESEFPTVNFVTNLPISVQHTNLDRESGTITVMGIREGSSLFEAHSVVNNIPQTRIIEISFSKTDDFGNYASYSKDFYVNLYTETGSLLSSGEVTFFKSLSYYRADIIVPQGSTVRVELIPQN